MDIIELLLQIKDSPLPKDRETLLKDLLFSPFQIVYEEVIRYSPSFREAYPPEYIKSLLRKGNIKMENYEAQIRGSDLTEEEKYLLYFFLKGKGPLQIYENNKYPFRQEGEIEYEQDYNA